MRFLTKYFWQSVFKSYTIFNYNDTSIVDITHSVDSHADYYIWVDRAVDEEANDIGIEAYNYFNKEK